MKLVLAPLAGFTDAPFRLMCGEGGADLTYTEMVSAAGLAHGSSPTRHLMEKLPGEVPLACQIFGSKEEEVMKIFGGRPYSGFLSKPFTLAELKSILASVSRGAVRE